MGHKPPNSVCFDTGKDWDVGSLTLETDYQTAHILYLLGIIATREDVPAGLVRMWVPGNAVPTFYNHGNPYTNPTKIQMESMHIQRLYNTIRKSAMPME